MYLTRFMETGVGPGNWGPVNFRGMDSMLNELDDTLNSWKEAHHQFETYQGDEPYIQVSAFLRFVELTLTVHRGQSQYVLEALAYALLERWIEVRQADIRLGN